MRAGLIVEYFQLCFALRGLDWFIPTLSTSDATTPFVSSYFLIASLIVVGILEKNYLRKKGGVDEEDTQDKTGKTLVAEECELRV